MVKDLVSKRFLDKSIVSSCHINSVFTGLKLMNFILSASSSVERDYSDKLSSKKSLVREATVLKRNGGRLNLITHHFIHPHP